MKNSLILILTLGILVSCTNDPQSKEQPKSTEISQTNSLELIDIRIYENGGIKINGISLSESALESHLNSLPINEETKVRVTSSDKVYTGLVNRLSKELVVRNIENIQFNMMSSEEFNRLENNMIIDVLNSGQIMMDGLLLYPEDLAIAFRKNEYPDNLTVMINVSEEVKMGPLTDIQKILKTAKVSRIEYSGSRS